MRLEVFPVSHKGYLLARRLSPGFTGALIHSPKGLRKHGLARKVKRAFLSSDGLIFISAAGIAVRTIAPFLRGKHLDPAVVVMDEAGRFAVSLVSGHLGGANELARNLAALIGATPVITTATDSWGLPCAEDIVKRFGLAIEDVRKIKPVNSAILKGGPVLIIDAEARRLKDIRAYLGNKDSGIFSFGRVLPATPRAKACVFITSMAYTGFKRPMNDKTLILRPREFTAGVGCMRGASSKEIEGAVKGAFKEADISFLSVRNLATIDIKKDEAGLIAFALRHGLEIDFFSAEELNKAPVASSPSAFVREKTGARAVAEPASLLSSGAKKIWIRKRISGRVTVAASKALYTSLA